MLNRVIKVIKDWGICHQKEDKVKSLEFLNCKWQQYNLENNNHKDAKGLVELGITHPNNPTEFPGVNFESEQPHHHHAVKIIDDSKDKHKYAAQHNASLDDLPHKTAGVSTALGCTLLFVLLLRLDLDCHSNHRIMGNAVYY
jgi:hypothetical protein